MPESKSSKKASSEKSLPEVNIGLVGHVDHGKTTLTEALSGKWTDTHSEEVKRGITIRIGYADISFYRCPKCKGTEAYSTSPKCMKCFSNGKLQRTVSLVDAPGHETLMATVLAGAALMDGAILVIAADEPCPQPQTSEHLLALDIADIKNIVVVQNKIDRVSPEEAKNNYKEIKEFLRGTVAENAPIVPISAQYRVNIDALIETIEKTIPTPKRDPNAEPKMLVARSFDVNKPGTPIEKLKGAVLGGSLVSGKLSVGDDIEIKPGHLVDGKMKGLSAKVTGLHKAQSEQKSVTPGGLIGLSTSLDPALAKSDALSGSVVGSPGKMPPVRDELALKIHMLERVVGSRERMSAEPIREGVPLMLTVGTARTVGAMTGKRDGSAVIRLKLPVCAEKGEKVAISRQVGGRWHLVGWGEIA
ncbi:MAG: translation initiation factor IF-2 subunit gamma [Candidatus Aenigmarchaeota archaeon]|nr:translation initiation factor IF-2 subunit gamma [Candidatus Aenigmarchaeota archaeon]